MRPILLALLLVARAAAQTVILDDRPPTAAGSTLGPTVASYSAAAAALMPFRGQSPKLVIRSWHGALGSLDWAVGADADHPAVIDGTAAPVIDTGGRTFIDALCPPNGGHLLITGVKIRAGTRAANGPNCYGISLVGPWQDVTIDGCDIAGFFVNISIQSPPPGGQPIGPYCRGITIRNCVIADAYQVGPSPHAEGLYLAYCDGALLEHNVFDHNGWSESIAGADPTVFRHNVYIYPSLTSGVIVRGNIVARGAASGLRCGGQICENNIVLANPVGIIAAPGCVRVAGNVVLDSRDIDASHPIGVGIDVSGTGVRIVNNVLAGRSSPNLWNLAAIQLHDGATGAQITGNVIDGWGNPNTPAAAVAWSGLVNPLFLYNNRIRMPAGTRVIWGETSPGTLGFNRFWGGDPRGYFETRMPVAGDFAAFHAATAGTGDVLLNTAPVPTLEAFMALHGGGGLAEYLAAARARKPWVWELAAFAQGAT